MSLSYYDTPNARVTTGLSTDTKPATAPQGSRFVTTDTYAVYIFLGSAWVAATEFSTSGATIPI